MGSTPAAEDGPVVGDRRTSSALQVVEPGSTAGIGSLPHRNARLAAEFAMTAYDLPTIPNLPRRSPAESAVAQALVGVPGVTSGQYGTVAVDPSALDPEAPVDTELWRDHFTGFRTFLELAVERDMTGPVKWQFVGPLSVGAALCRGGASPELAFRVASHVVGQHLRGLSAAVTSALPASPQLVVLDEPLAGDLMAREFPIAPDEAIDRLSSAMAVLESRATIGVHCCGTVDVATLIEAGPNVLSLPVSSSLVPLAGYVDRFLQNGGWIAWGAIATEGPIGITSNRSWHQMSTLWCQLVERGCDPTMLREQCILTPECGLGTHSADVAERVCHSLRDIARSIRSEAAAAKFVLGA